MYLHLIREENYVCIHLLTKQNEPILACIRRQRSGLMSAYRDNCSRNWWWFGAPIEQAFGRFSGPGALVPTTPLRFSNKRVVLSAGVKCSGTVCCSLVC